jgi:FkbM family methyltransferase
MGLRRRIRAFVHPPLDARTATFDQPSGVDIVHVGKFEIAYRRTTADEEVLKESFDNDISFPAIRDHHISSDDIVIDVGAHIGTFSLLASERVPSGIVHAIEASIDSYSLLRINVALNKRNNIRTHRLALAGGAGTLKLYYDQGNWGHSVVHQLSDRFEEVPATSLTDFLDSNQIERCRLLKMNCEGAEFPILLQTAPATLARIETLLVLYHCDLRRTNSLSDLEQQLKGAGFKLDIRASSDLRGWIVASRQ